MGDMGIPTWYVTSHSGKLSLLPTAGWEMTTSQGAVTVLFAWEGNRSLCYQTNTERNSKH